MDKQLETAFKYIKSETDRLMDAVRSEIYNRRLAKVNRIYMDQDWDRGRNRKWDA